MNLRYHLVLNPLFLQMKQYHEESWSQSPLGPELKYQLYPILV